MKIAVFEQIITSGGHEIEFDRLIVEELCKAGHEVFFYVPEGHKFKFDYGVDVIEIKGKGINYAGARGIRKAWLAFQRERRRIGWFNELYRRGNAGEYDLLIMPTTTQRYLRSLRYSKLAVSSKPVEFIVHGVRPEEVVKMTERLEKIPANCPARMVVLTLMHGLFSRPDKRVVCINPPAYTPRDIVAGKLQGSGPVKFGFYGQYRREKKLDGFLDTFLECGFGDKVRLVVQGATNRQEDREDFERTIRKYSGNKDIEFIHRGLIGPEWQSALAAADVIMIPYAAPRYRYHWSAMLFSAIGYFRPVVSVGDVINPEVMNEYHIGESFAGNDMKSCKEALQRIVDKMFLNKASYNDELERAYSVYAPEVFVRTLLEIATQVGK